MFKKIISMTTAVLLMASGFAITGITTASAADLSPNLVITAKPTSGMPASNIIWQDSNNIALEFTIGTPTWSPTLSGGSFAANTVYQATVVITPGSGFTFPNVSSNSFVLSGAGTSGATVTHSAITAGAASATLVITFPDSGSGGGGGGGGLPTTTVSNVTSTSAFVDYTSIGNYAPASGVSTFVIRLYPSSGSTVLRQESVPRTSGFTYTFTGLTPSTTYRVQVVDPVMFIGWIASVPFTTLAGSSSTPTLSAAEIAAAAAEAARAAEAAAAAVRAAEIATAQTALSTVLKSDKPGTLSEYRSANINISTTAALTRLNAEVLKLSAADRADFAKIKAIADKIEFDETFFNATARPSIATYSTYGVTGVTERILPTVNAKVLELPVALRADVKAMQEIAKVENFVDRVANPSTRSTISASTLVANGLLPATSPYKHSLLRALSVYPEDSLNTMAKIEAAIKEQIYKAEAPKRHLAEIKARIAARNK